MKFETINNISLSEIEDSELVESLLKAQEEK